MPKWGNPREAFGTQQTTQNPLPAKCSFVPASRAGNENLEKENKTMTSHVRKKCCRSRQNSNLTKFKVFFGEREYKDKCSVSFSQLVSDELENREVKSYEKTTSNTKVSSYSQETFLGANERIFALLSDF